MLLSKDESTRFDFRIMYGLSRPCCFLLSSEGCPIPVICAFGMGV